MALKPVVDKIEDVPEAFRVEYLEKEGKFHLDVEGGLKTNEDVTKLQGALSKERTDHGKTREKLGSFSALGTPEELRTKLDRIPELEIAAEGKIDEKKLEKLVETRLASKVAPVERERDQLKTKVGELEVQVNAFQGEKRTRSIHDALRAAAGKAKVADTAVDDALLLGERVFDIVDGVVVTKDGVGVTPGLNPEVWFTEMQSKRPHWWGASVGGGASGGNNGVPINNPFTHEHWNMTEQGKLVTANRARAEQMAKSAGTTIGGGKPPAKK